MSTKTYNGFRVNRPIHEIIPFLKKCRAAMEPTVTELAKRAQCARLLRLAIDVHSGVAVEDIEKRAVPYTIRPDRVKSYNFRLMDNPLYWVHTMLEVWERHNEFVQGHLDMDSTLHLELNMALFPYEGCTIGITYGAQKLQDLFEKLPGVYDFSYWNSSEGPDDMSEQEWEERGDIWRKVLPTGVPNRDGFLYELFSESNTVYPFISETDVQSFLDERRDSYVIALTKEALYKQIKNRIPEFGNSEDVAGAALQLRSLAIAAEKANAPEYVALLESVEREFPRTWEELRAWFPVSIPDLDQRP